MINLIPPRAKKSLLKEYWIRVVSSWLLLLSLALLLATSVTLPLFVLINSKISVYETDADKAAERVADYELVSTNLMRASQQGKFVVDEENYPNFSSFIDIFGSLENSSVRINEISISREETEIYPVTISGFAADRQSLATFRDLILAREEVSDVDLPISNLARDKDINFSIKVTLNNDL